MDIIIGLSAHIPRDIGEQWLVLMSHIEII